MAEYLELARAVIEEREGSLSADTTIFYLNEKQYTRIWRKLRQTCNYFPRTLSNLQFTTWPTSCQVFKKHAQTMRRRESATRSPGATILPLNEIQCTHLWRVIRVVYNYISSSQLSAPHHKRYKYLPEIFREFYVLVTRANAIVQQFISEKSWLQAAIFEGNHRLVFKKLILDLQAYVRLFHGITKYPVPVEASATISRHYIDMERDSNFDAINFRSRVEDLLVRPALGEKERLLAHYLLEREKSMSSSDCQDVDLPQFFIAKGGYPTMGRPIGRGSSGVVLEVKWLGMTCAKKFFSVMDNKGSMQKECLKEMCILAKLNHPHIVKLLCTTDLPEISFLMEFMPMSLSDFIEKWWKDHKCGILPAAAIDMMLQIAEGIEYLHDQDIVHRDLKSSNILVSPSAHKKLREVGYAVVKVTDLGLSKMKGAGSTKPTQEKMGTTYWRAPEAFAADEPIDWKKADAYSFAMLFSEILTGDIPFDTGRPLSELYTRIKSGERPKLPSSCPEALASLLNFCWDTTPSVRPSFNQIREELTSIKRSLLTGSLEWTSLE